MVLHCITAHDNDENYKICDGFSKNIYSERKSRKDRHVDINMYVRLHRYLCIKVIFTISIPT